MITIQNLSHSFPLTKKGRVRRGVLYEINLKIESGEIFGLLGPNGGGKTTLFRILSTLLTPISGSAEILGLDVVTKSDQVRKKIGVVFQNPSVDKNLTVYENLQIQGQLYGIEKSELEHRIQKHLNQLDLADRKKEIVLTLSGGLKRRVEIAKALLHEPEVLIMDEPSTGLDPNVRRDLWKYLNSLKAKGLTILLTTHLMDEAELCDRLGILNKGRLIALGSPTALKKKIGGDVILLQSADPERLVHLIESQFGDKGKIMDKTIRIEKENGHVFIPQLAKMFPDEIESIAIGKPTLEDVFVHMTGEDFWKQSNQNGAEA